MTFLLWSLVVFTGAAIYDFVFARYLRANAEGRAVSAANWSVTTYLVGLVGLSSVLQYSKWYAIPEVLGLWVGTYVGSRAARPARTVPKC